MKDVYIEIRIRCPREGEDETKGTACISFEGPPSPEKGNPKDALRVERRDVHYKLEPEEGIIALWVKMSWLVGVCLLERAREIKNTRANQ